MTRLRCLLRCLLRGHEPGAERDAVGRPVRCARCGTYAVHMALWQWHRFLGRDAAAQYDRLVRERANMTEATLAALDALPPNPLDVPALPGQYMEKGWRLRNPLDVLPLPSETLRRE